MKGSDKSKLIPQLPSRLITDDDLKSFYEVMKISETTTPVVLPDSGMKRKSGYLGGLDTHQYGRGKRAREVCLQHNLINICPCLYTVIVLIYVDCAMHKFDLTPYIQDLSCDGLLFALLGSFV